MLEKTCVDYQHAILLSIEICVSVEFRQGLKFIHLSMIFLYSHGTHLIAKKNISPDEIEEKQHIQY